MLKGLSATYGGRIAVCMLRFLSS